MDTEYGLGIPHPVTPYPKLIINAAITGMVPMKSDTPHIPVSVDEIISDATACYMAGASIVHIHARDEDGQPTHHKTVYADIIRGIRSNCPDVIVCTTTSGRVHNTFEKRSEVLDLEGDLKPDMASLTMGSLNFPKRASINQPDMINTARVLMKRGVLEPPFYCNILLGSIYSAPATLFDLTHMVMSLPPRVHWAATGIGKFQLKINLAALLMGGHVRVGLEDNIYYDQDAAELATNPMLIERIVRFAGEIGRGIASASEARTLLGMTQAII